MEDTTTCPLLGHPAAVLGIGPVNNSYDVSCEICGHYSLSGTLMRTISNEPEQVRRALSWYTRECEERSVTPDLLTTENVQKIVSAYPDLPVIEKADRYLRALAKYTPYPGSSALKVHAQFYEPLVRAQTTAEVKYLRRYLIEAGLARPNEKGELIITVPGWQKLDRERELSGRSGQAFVAMWFDASARGSGASRCSDAPNVAFRLSQRRRHPGTHIFRGSMPGPHVPLSTLHPRPYGRRRMIWGRCGLLRLHRVTLAFTTPLRFQPAHCEACESIDDHDLHTSE